MHAFVWVKDGPCACRKALDRMSKRLVEEALKGAISGCVEEHRKRRVLLTNVGRLLIHSCVVTT